MEGGTEENPLTINQRVTVNGDVHLILADGCNLTVNGGIGLSDANTNITIYGQSAGTGALTAIAGGNNAGIGSNRDGNCGNITIIGGKIDATGGESGGAGIGGGDYGTVGSITINGGTIKAESQADGAGIGSGYYGTVTSITITGGTITASSGLFGAGIGSGDFGSCGLITISGGTVHALSGLYGDGIGNGDDGHNATFSTGTNGSAVIYATVRNGNDQPIIGMNTSSWSGIFFLNNDSEGFMNGTTIQPIDDFEIPLEKPLTVEAGQTLIIPEGVTLTVNGELIINGTLIVDGTLINNGTISGSGMLDYEEGEMSGSGSVADTVTVIEPQPDPEPTPEPEEPEQPEEREEEETYIPSEPISDGVHEYSLGKMLYVDGKRVKGLYEYEGSTYYFNEQGFMQTGWVELEDGWRYFAEDGKMLIGWLQIGNVWYYLDPETGLMYNDGLATIGKSAYYFYDWGGMASDWWYEAEDGWYFFGGSGAMKSAQWLEWEGDWYYLTETGKMAVDTEVGGFYVNAEGVWVE